MNLSLQQLDEIDEQHKELVRKLKKEDEVIIDV
jgi:hypothetical protein